MRTRRKQGNRRPGTMQDRNPKKDGRRKVERDMRQTEASLTNWQTSQWEKACKGHSAHWPPRELYVGFVRGQSIDFMAQAKAHFAKFKGKSQQQTR